MPVEARLHRVEQPRQVTLGLGHRQRTGRKGHAGQRVAPQRRRAAVAVERVLAHQRVDRAARRGRDARDHQVLIRGQAEVARVRARDGVEAIQRAAGDAAGGNAQGEVPAAVVGLDPAEAVALRLEAERARRRDGEAGAALHLGHEPGQAVALDRVLELGVLAVAAVAMVALGGDHGLGQRQQLFRPHEADHVGEAREGAGFAVRGAESAADADVEAGQLAVLDDRDEAEVVRQHVDVVDRRHHQRGLELARQVGRAVDRLGLGRAGQAFAVEEDLVVRARRRQQVLRQPHRPGLRLRVGARLGRIRRAQHVAVDVAAGGDGVEQGRLQRLHRRLEFALEHAVDLERLARGQAQAAVAMPARDVRQRQPLRRRAHAARQARARHEAVRRLELLQAPFLAQVAVVLQVGAVELDQGGVGVGQAAGERVAQALLQRAAQAAAGGLDALDRGQGSSHQ